MSNGHFLTPWIARPAAFLDRDGVLNKPILRSACVGSPRCLEEFDLVAGAAQAVAMLRDAGLLVIVVTNQPEVARGLIAPAQLERMHRRLKEATAVDAIYTCPHDDRHACSCRKPSPGLLLQAAAEWRIALGISYMVGDSWKDIEAGTAAGCQTFLVDPQWPRAPQVKPSHHVRDLRVAAEMIAALARPNGKDTFCGRTISR